MITFLRIEKDEGHTHRRVHNTGVWTYEKEVRKKSDESRGGMGRGHGNRYKTAFVRARGNASVYKITVNREYWPRGGGIARLIDLDQKGG